MSIEVMRYKLLTKLVDQGMDIGSATRRVNRMLRFIETGVAEKETKDG